MSGFLALTEACAESLCVPGKPSEDGSLQTLHDLYGVQVTQHQKDRSNLEETWISLFCFSFLFYFFGGFVLENFSFCWKVEK